MAYNFNGTNQYLDFGIAVSNEPLTMACWFRSTSTTSEQMLVTINATTAFFKLAARGDQAGDPVEAGKSNGSNGQDARTTAAYTANTWTHACGVFTADNSITSYINGGSSGSGTINVTDTAQVWSKTGIGCLRRATPILFLSGDIADVGIWNAALTAAEVGSLAKGIACRLVRPQSLVFYAPLVREAIDMRSAYTITNNNSATVSTHPRVYV